MSSKDIILQEQPLSDQDDDQQEQYEQQLNQQQEIDDGEEIECSQNDKQEIQDQQEEQSQTIEKNKQINIVDLKNKQKGVVYLSKIPPYMPASQVRQLLEPYGIERMYLVPEDDKKRLYRIKMGGNKARSYEEGWVEFTDKRIARSAAESLNGTKMINKKNNFYSEDRWQIKYLPKFKWDNLTEKFAYDQKMRKQKMQKQLQIAKKERDFYVKNKDLSKKLDHINKRMQKKKISKEKNQPQQIFRNLNQKSTVQKEIYQQQEQ